jgi:hypothetical protein
MELDTQPGHSLSFRTDVLMGFRILEHIDKLVDIPLEVLIA